MDPVVHLEVPFDDRRRMARFCESPFGGGTPALGELTDIPGIGSHRSFMETEGNRVSLLQPPPRA